VFIVGFREPRKFAPPEPRNHTPKFRDILEPEPPEKYTLTKHLWNYLQDYAKKHQAAGNGFGYGMVDLDGVSRTLSARYYKDGSEILIPRGRGQVPRRLTPRECARLMGFPERFQIPVSDTQAYKQFGNSVVVPVATAMALRVIEALRRPADLDAQFPISMPTQLSLVAV
ncbi:MAG: DNA cytosine methyltransferase, partial [Terriglobales bacterium]